MGTHPWDYYPYYASSYYPYDDNGSYLYDYSGYPYDYYGGYYPYDDYQNNNDNDSTNAASDQYASNPTVSAVQSELAKLGYYNGAVDGVLGDQTEAALARYQDRDLSVTGTLDPATLRSRSLLIAREQPLFDQYASNPTVSAVQSELAKLGYYNGAVDGVLGDQTEAALARYQEDRDLSVTGTLNPATLRSLGLAPTRN